MLYFYVSQSQNSTCGHSAQEAHRDPRLSSWLTEKNHRTAEEGEGQAGLKGLVDEWRFELVFEVQERVSEQQTCDGVGNEKHMCVWCSSSGVCIKGGERETFRRKDSQVVEC